jgi:hypothetical protein
MNRLLVSATWALIWVVSGHARQARAEGYVESDKLLGAPALGALDLGLSTADIVLAVRGQQPAHIYAGAELLLTAPQIVIFARFYQSTNPAERGTRFTWSVAMVWAGALSLHGLVDLVRPASWPQRAPADAAAAPQVTASGWSLAPAVVDSGARRTCPGIALGGYY